MLSETSKILTNSSGNKVYLETIKQNLRAERDLKNQLGPFFYLHYEIN